MNYNEFKAEAVLAALSGALAALAEDYGMILLLRLRLHPAGSGDRPGQSQDQRDSEQRRWGNRDSGGRRRCWLRWLSGSAWTS